MPEGNPSSGDLDHRSRAWRERIAPFYDIEILLFALVLSLVAALYVHYTNPIVRWNDTAGYVYAGKRIAEIGRPAYFNANNASIGPYFTFRSFLLQLQPGDGNTYWTYAIGFPLVLAASFLLPLPNAHLFVAPALSLVGLVFLFILGRMLFGRWVGLMAAGLLALSFDYWAFSTEPWSDVPAVTFTLAGMVFAIAGTRKNSGLLGALGGVLLGFAALIRYPAVLALAPLAVYLLIITRGKTKPWRAFGAALAGLGLMAALGLGYQAAAFGGALSTGYSANYGWVPWWPMFSWDNFIGNSPAGRGGYQLVLSSLWSNVQIGLIFALIGVLIMPRAEAILIGGNILIFCLFYAAFLWPVSDARFVMFALALVCLAAAYTVVHLLQLVPWRNSRWLALALIAILAVWHAPDVKQSERELLARNAHSQVVVDRVRAITGDSEPNAVFLSQQYNDMIILYGGRTALYYALLAQPDLATRTYPLDQYETNLVSVVEQLLAQGTPVYMIQEPRTIRYRQGPIDPYPILSSHFSLQQVRLDPPVYKVVSASRS